MVFITKKIQFKNCLAAAVSFHVHLKLTTLKFLEPTVLLHRGLSNFTYLVNGATLGESVKDENLVGRWLRIRERFIWLLGANGDAVARAMDASEEGDQDKLSAVIMDVVEEEGHGHSESSHNASVNASFIPPEIQRSKCISSFPVDC